MTKGATVDVSTWSGWFLPMAAPSDSPVSVATRRDDGAVSTHAVERTDPPFEANERDTLSSFLDYYRATIALKCDGVSEDQLRERALPPSNLSLLGIVRHLAEVERSWFRRNVVKEVNDGLWVSDDDVDADFDHVEHADVAEAFAAWREHCERSRQILAGVASLDDTFTSRHGAISLRWLLVHMVEEYARHAGHADLLRERLDGATGD